MKISIWKLVLVQLVLVGIVCKAIYFSFKGLNTAEEKSKVILSLSNNFQIIPECGCQRQFFFRHQNITEWNKLNSTCSDTSSLFTEGQNVVTYTYFKPNSHKSDKILRDYRSKIMKNIQQIRLYYPDFVIRIYSDSDLDSDLCTIICGNPDIQWCDIRKTPSHGDLSKMYFRTWRFLSLGDPSVNIFLSRDLDSIITEREQGAVHDWLENTTKPIQVMRDHHIYHRAEIMAGMWGARNNLLGSEISTKLQKAIIDISVINMTKPKFFDQWLLAGVVWPFKELIVAYDSYYCETLGKQTMFRPYNVQRKNRKNDYVSLREGENWNFKPCPEKCRPSYGKNWTYC